MACWPVTKWQKRKRSDVSDAVGVKYPNCPILQSGGTYLRNTQMTENSNRKKKNGSPKRPEWQATTPHAIIFSRTCANTRKINQLV